MKVNKNYRLRKLSASKARATKCTGKVWVRVLDSWRRKSHLLMTRKKKPSILKACKKAQNILYSTNLRKNQMAESELPCSVRIPHCRKFSDSFQSEKDCLVSEEWDSNDEEESLWNSELKTVPNNLNSAKVVVNTKISENSCSSLPFMENTVSSDDETSDDEFPSYLGQNFSNHNSAENESSGILEDVVDFGTHAFSSQHGQNEILMNDGLLNGNNIEQNLFICPVHEKSLMIAVLQHPVEVVLHGMALVHVLHGSVTALGCNLNSSVPYLPFFSSEKFTCITLSTQQPEEIPESSSVEQEIERKLKEIEAEKIFSDIKKFINSNSVVISLKKNFKVREVEYACSFLKLLFHPCNSEIVWNNLTQSNFQVFGFMLSLPSQEKRFIENYLHSNLADEVIEHINESQMHNTPAPRIIVCGNKNVGKSTLLRYLINRVLNQHEVVYYLDADPGQTELTAPGCVSLTKIIKPLLGPPFTHQKTPERMCFVGGVNISNFPGLYIESIHGLCDYYIQNLCSFPLFINTMGWTSGIGLSLLVDIIRAFQPTFVVQIESKNAVITPLLSPEFVYHTASGWGTDGLPFGTSLATYKLVEFPFPGDEFTTRKDSLAPHLKRSLTLLSYLGRLQQLHTDLLPINHFTPYSVPWSSVSVHVCNEDVPPHQIFYTLNGSLVALCKVNESQILESEDSSLPKLLANTPVNICIGFGIVRSIDPMKKVFYIITPEPLERLHEVNALLKGNVHLPEELIKTQVVDIPVPYVNEISDTRKLGVASKAIKNRSFRTRLYSKR